MNPGEAARTVQNISLTLILVMVRVALDECSTLHRMTRVTLYCKIMHFHEFEDIFIEFFAICTSCWAASVSYSYGSAHNPVVMGSN